MKQKLLILLASLLAAITIYANGFKVDGIYYKIISTSEVEVADWDKINCPEQVIIPNQVTNNGISYYVTSIGDKAFYECKGLTAVTIPNSVTSIGHAAFLYCTSLISVEIPNSVASIGESAFSSCTSLISVEIPNSVTSIGKYAFNCCTSLISVEIPNSVTSIGDSTFSSCASLISVEIPSSITKISPFAFCNCYSLPSVTIPNSVTSIGLCAFSQCKLKEVRVSWENPAGLEIQTNSFNDVHNITLYVPIGTTENYKYRSPWNNFKEILEYVPGGNEGDEKCEAPVISIDDGTLAFSSPTPGANFYYTIDCDDEHSLTNSKDGLVVLTGTYQISAYAYAEGYDHSEVVTATLVWVNPQIEGAGVMSMEAKKAVLIKSVGDHIQICGTEHGENVQLYTIDGILLSTTKASDVETIIPFSLHKGEIYIIQYDDKSIKYKF